MYFSKPLCQGSADYKVLTKFKKPGVKNQTLVASLAVFLFTPHTGCAMPPSHHDFGDSLIILRLFAAPAQLLCVCGDTAIQFDENFDEV